MCVVCRREDLVGFIKPKQIFFQQVLLQKAVWANVRVGSRIARKPYRRHPELFHGSLRFHGVDLPVMLLKSRGPGPAPELGSSSPPIWGSGVFISHEYHYLLMFIYRQACAVRHRKRPQHHLDRDSVGNSLGCSNTLPRASLSWRLIVFFFMRPSNQELGNMQVLDHPLCK